MATPLPKRARGHLQRRPRGTQDDACRRHRGRDSPQSKGHQGAPRGCSSISSAGDHPMIRRLVCFLAFTVLIVVAWKGIAIEPFEWTSWRPWTCWALTHIAAWIYSRGLKPA